MQRQNFAGLIRFSRVLLLSLLVVMLVGLLKPEAAVQPVSFGAKTDFATGSNPFSVAAGDFNGDGTVDLAVANRGSNTVSIMLGTGTGSFGAKTDFGTGTNPVSVAVGDFDRDGKLDLAVANNISNTVSILLGMGTGSFGAKTDFGTGPNPRSVAVGDFNGDGKVDLAVANFNGFSVSILLGTGTGSFGANTDFGTGSFPTSVAVGDFNGDGKLDLAVTNLFFSTVSILLGTGTGSFGVKTDFGTGNTSFSVAVGDFNGDGKLDLAVGNQGDATISILLGTGTGSFGAKSDFGTGVGPNSVAVGDFNGDGKLDLATANSNSTVSLLLGTGTGSFGPKTDFGTGSFPQSAAMGDFNGDGKLDLAVANFVGDTVSILLNTTPIVSAGVFCPRTDFATADHPVSVALGDFNGDGKLDLAVANNVGNNVSILLGTGTGSFGAKTDFGTGISPFSVAVGDFNGDGKLDLAVANGSFTNTVSILLGTGAGTFGAKTDFGVSTNPVSVAVADFNGDGNLDVVVANETSNTVSVLLGTGTGSFGAKTDFATGGGPASVAVADFNGDGKLDLATANGDGSTSILLGTGTGSFGAKTDFVAGLFPDFVAVGDFNGDGKVDLAVANFGVSTVSILLGTGTGSFGAKTDFGTALGPKSVAVGDFNGDGRLDLAVTDYAVATVSILLGTGTGSFGAKTDFGTGNIPYSVATGDFNGDGKLDLAVANFNSHTVSILLNNTPPNIAAAPVTRNAGNSANSLIAVVDDAQDGPNTLNVTVNGGMSATVNGVTVTLNPTAPNASGQVFADVVAACTATTASFTLRVTDSCGLFTEATLTVTVNPDNQAPTVNCAAVPAQSANANANCQAVVPDVRALVRAQSSDCTAPASLTVTQNPVQGSIVSGTGSHPIVVTVTDASNNSTTCTVAFTVNDVAAPTINCAAVPAQSANANANCQATVPDVRALVRAQSADSCTTQASLTVTQNPAQGSSVSGAGSHPITVNVTDASNNSANCIVAFTVIDNTPPTLVCPASFTVVAGAGCPIGTNNTVSYAAPTVSDNCPGATSACSPPSGSRFPVGTTTVNCTASDTSGNTATCSFLVTVFSLCVQDNSNPGNVVLVDSSTGAYRFCCNGVLVASGIGTRIVRGCTLTISDSSNNRLVQILIDGAVMKGTASVKQGGNILCTIQDNNLANNTCVCQ